MDTKEVLGIGGFVVIGGALGYGQLGLGSALSADLREASSVSAEERPAYMQSVVEEFSEAFDTYMVETETFYYVGYSDFEADPKRIMFVENVRPEEGTEFSKSERKEVRESFGESDFCQSEEMLMFTQAGWSYSFTLRDGRGGKIASTTCHPGTPTLRPATQA